MNKKEIIIFFALKNEAKAFLSKSKIQIIKSANNEYSVKVKDYIIRIIITGVGKRNIEKCLSKKIILNPFLIIKAGTCAVLDNNINLCSIILPLYLGYDDKKIILDYSKMPGNINNIIKEKIISKGLYTVDKPLFDKKKAEKLFLRNYSLVDMETFFIKSKFPDIPLLPLLIGTDRANNKAKFDFLSNLKFATKLLKDEIIKIINIL